MCGVPGRADNGTQISLYPAALYNPGQKAEYRYVRTSANIKSSGQYNQWKFLCLSPFLLL